MENVTPSRSFQRRAISGGTSDPPVTTRRRLRSEPPPPSLPDTLWQIALLVPMSAITVKRFNDTDRPAWLGYLFGPLGAALYLGPHLKDWVGSIGSTTLLPLLVALFVYFVFALIDNGFIRGTGGPNRYGPDPLAASAAPA